MAAGVDAIRPPMAVADGVRAWVAQEAAVLASLAVVAGLVLATLPYQVAQDSWLSLVAGRDIVAHGLPHVDTLTALGGGRAWIDQQWLAHLVLYGTYRAGGMGLVLALHAAVLILTFSLAALAARRLGGAPAQVALMLMAAAAAAPWAWQLRAQTFALPFAVVLVWLLAEDARRPSPRVLLAVPLLVLWANVHGSVLLAAGIVGLAGLLAARHRRPEAVVLLAAPAAVLASPYGFELVGYYRRMLGDRVLAQYVTEWQPAWPGAFTVVFYLVAAVTLVAVVRRGATFERLLLPVLMLAGCLAIRNVVWLVLAALVLVPGLLSRGDTPAAGRPMRVFAAVAMAGAACAAIYALGSTARLDRTWDDAAAADIAATPGLVFAEESAADWLLWKHPELAGRLVFDARFELLRPTELAAVTDLYQLSDTAVVADARTVVVDSERVRLRQLLEQSGFRRAGASDSFAVLRRGS